MATAEKLPPLRRFSTFGCVDFVSLKLLLTELMLDPSRLNDSHHSGAVVLNSVPLFVSLCLLFNIAAFVPSG